jgi:dolichol kinase
MSFRNELWRKSIHLSSLWIPLACYFLPRPIGLLLLAVVAIGVVGVDVLRIRGGAVRNLYNRILGPVLREHETLRLTGASYMLVSAVLTLFLFQNVVAAMATAYLIVGDTLAALVGKTWGRRRFINKKTMEGSLACFMACLLIGLVVPAVTWPLALIGALTATILEVLPWKFDDNITIPLGAGAVLWGCMKVMGM